MSKFLQGVPTYSQAVVAEFIDEGHFASHIRRMRKIYAERHESLCDAAKRKLAGLLDVVPAESGLHTIGYLRQGVRESDASRAADARKITASPIARFSIAPVDVNGLVLGFGGVTPQQIRSGVGVLAEVLEERLAAGPCLSVADKVRRAKPLQDNRQVPAALS